jgi:hypothetical protein
LDFEVSRLATSRNAADIAPVQQASPTVTLRFLSNRSKSLGASMPSLGSQRGCTQFNVSAAWGLMRMIFATNIGGQIFVRRASTNLCFLEAGAPAQFIAGDQPIANFGGTEHVELYYPLTPTRALKLALDHERPGVESKALTDVETRAHNQRIRDASEEQLYAASEAALVELGAPPS